MNRLHAFLLATLLAAAAVAATYGVAKTTSLGMSSKEPAAISDTQLAARSSKLDKLAADLRRAARQTPPALPKLPKRRTAPVARVVSSGPTSRPPLAAAPPSAAAPSTESDDSSHDEDEGSDD